MVKDGKMRIPTWDLTAIYPGLDSPEYAASVATLVKHIEDLETLLTAAEALKPGDVDAVTLAFDRMIGLFNEALGLARHNHWYLQAHLSGDTRDLAA